MYRTIFLFLPIWSVTSGYAQPATQTTNRTNSTWNRHRQTSGHPMPGCDNYAFRTCWNRNLQMKRAVCIVDVFQLRGSIMYRLLILGYEPGIFRGSLVTSFRQKEGLSGYLTEENVPGIKRSRYPPADKQRTALSIRWLCRNRLMLSVEEASRYAGELDDPARLMIRLPV